MTRQIARHGLRWSLWTSAFVAVLVSLVLLPQMSSADKADPSPSPLFQNSLEKSVARFNSESIDVPKLPEGVEIAAVPHPDQKVPLVDGGQAVTSSPDVTVDDCMQTFAVIVMSPDPGDQLCDIAGFPVDLAGPTIVRRDGPPYATSTPIPIEMVQLDLQSVAPTPVGDVGMQLNPSLPSPGQIVNIVADLSGEFVSGDVFFDVFVQIDLPNMGMQLENRDPIQVGSPITSLPPAQGTSFQMIPGHPSVALFPVGSPTSPPVAWICFVEHIIDEPCKVCIYEVTCITGTPDSSAHIGICVGDRRQDSNCPNNTCSSGFNTVLGDFCMVWSLVACEPSNLPPVPGPFGGCACEPSATMPSSPTCPGESTCPSGASCQGAATCSGYASCGSSATCYNTSTCREWPTCAYSQTCPEYPSCPGYYTCAGQPSCPSYPSCGSTPSCRTYPSCPSYPSCPDYATCHNNSTCQGQPTCTTTPTCGGAISCDSPSSYAVVYSVQRDTTAPFSAEGLTVPGHPEPNDVYALGIGNGYFTEGELFQSSGASLGAPPDVTNVDRISSTLGIGPGPVGGPPYTGPFFPNTGAPVPTPPPAGGFGTFELRSGDNIDALSYGIDGGQVLLFSVNTLAVGRVGSAVHYNSTVSPVAPPLGPVPSNGGGDPGDEAAGDIYRSARFRTFGGAGSTGPVITPTPWLTNGLETDELLLGLQAPAIAHSAGIGIGEDDIDALEADDAKRVDHNLDGIPDSSVYFSLDAASVQVIAPTADPFPGVSTLPDPDGVTQDDILITPVPAGPAFAYAIWARGVADIGLLSGDELDAVAVYDAARDGILSPADEILFSLSGSSPSLVIGANPAMPVGSLSPGDVYRWSVASGAITRYATARLLGLRKNDELDALDIGVCACSFDVLNLNGIGDMCEDTAFTPVGRNIGVAPNGCITLNYSDVLTPAYTRLNIAAAGPSPPAGQGALSYVGPCDANAIPKSAAPAYYEFTFEGTGSADPTEVCFEYDPALVSDPDSLKMWQWSSTLSDWVEITFEVDTSENTVCGMASDLIGPAPNKSAQAQALVVLTLPSSCTCNCHADPQCDGVTNVLDVVQTVNVAFRGSPPVFDAGCPNERTDVDCSGFSNVIDVVKMVNVAFRGMDPATQFCDPCGP